MTLKKNSVGVVAIALIVTIIAVACGESTENVIATNAAQNIIDNTNATREAIIAAGGDPDNPQGPQVGGETEAAKAQAAAKETATALAALPPSPTPTVVVIDVPEGPTLSDADNPTVEIGQNIFEPDILKVKVGTTVTWLNGRRSASSSRSLDGEAETWDSDALSKGTFDKEPASFQHTFTVLGCHKYGSFYSGETSRGAICVVE